MLHEYDYVYGDKKDVEISFVYYNFKKGKESKPISRTYQDALALARERANDGRYKNYEFLIY